MLADALKERLGRLDSRIKELEGEIAPLEQERRQLEEHRRQVVALLELENGSHASAVHLSVPTWSTGNPNWQAICDQYGYVVGGDSAHRVLMRNNPALHVTIRHECTYDRRSYP
jgi:hypothetical protein